MHFELSHLIVWIALWIKHTCSEFQVNTFSNNRDITKCQSFLTLMTTTPALTTPRLLQYLKLSPKTATLSIRGKNIHLVLFGLPTKKKP